MKKLLSLALVAHALACGASPDEQASKTERESTVLIDGGATDSSASALDGTVREAPSVLASRVDLALEMRTPTQIPGWDVTATVTDAWRASRTAANGRRSSEYVAIIRFQRGEEEPIELRFGPPEKRVHLLYGHSVAVWGATTLSVYPPGVEAWP